MNLKKTAFLACIAMFFHFSVSHGALLNSWENDEEGWTIVQGDYATAGFDTTIGVTNQSYSWIVSGGIPNPNYGAFLAGPASNANTSVLSSASSISIDVTVPTGGDFGGFLQWSAIIDNADTGYVSLDGYTYNQSPTIGDSVPGTLTWAVPASIRSTLASSVATTKVVFQVGGGTNGGTNNTMYVDNLRTTDVPEPASLLLLGSCCLLLIGTRRQHS